MFQESCDDPNIWIVKLKSNQKAFVYRFRLPSGVVESEERINSFFDKETGNIVIPKEEAPGPEEEDDESFKPLDFFRDLG